MPTVDYVFVDPSAITHEICVISDAEWNCRIEQERRWESDGRMARREVSLFDMIHAEIMDEHNAEKARVRNRRKADRKAKRKSGAYVKRNGGDFRKDEHYAGDKNLHYPESLLIAETRVKSKEKFDRADYEVAKDNDYAEIMDEKCLREQIDSEDKEREHVLKCAERKINRMTEEVEKLRSMELPTDWNSLYEFANYVAWVYDGIYYS